MSLIEVMKIALETGIEVIKGDKNIIEGIETVYEETSKSED